jgi:hypothetical protein
LFQLKRTLLVSFLLLVLLCPFARAASADSTYEAPSLILVLPNNVTSGSLIDAVIAGTNFRPGARVSLTQPGAPDLPGLDVVVESASIISCRFDLTGDQVGNWALVVQNDDGQTAVLLNAFKAELPNLILVGPVSVVSGPMRPTVSGGPGTALIKYTLSRDAEITIYIFNIRGERVWQTTLAAGGLGGSVGVNQISWQGVDNFKEKASSGVYFIFLNAPVGGKSQTIGKTKLVVL